jgi:flagellar protein FlaG
MSIEHVTGPTGAAAPAPALARPSDDPRTAPAAQAAAPDPAALQTRIDTLNRYLRSVDQSVRFERDEGTGLTIVRVVDESTAEVVRQIPTEAMLAIARTLARQKGLLVDDRA